MKKKKLTLTEYQKACLRTAGGVGGPKEIERKMLFWGLGVAGEAGDVAGCIKKTYRDKTDAFLPGLRENLGDTMWYIASICNTMNWSLDEILIENVEKLEKRYPKGFTRKKSLRAGKRVDWNEK